MVYGSGHNHSWTVTSSQAATCTSKGRKIETCSSCGEVRESEIPVIAHTFNNGPKCTVCGQANPNYTPAQSGSGSQSGNQNEGTSQENGSNQGGSNSENDSTGSGATSGAGSEGGSGNTAVTP